MADVAYTCLTDTELDEAEHRAKAAAAAEALSDTRPGIPHEIVRAEMIAELEALKREIARLPPA